MCIRDSGFISPYMADDPARLEGELTEPYILLTDQRLGDNFADIVPVLEAVSYTHLDVYKRQILLPYLLSAAYFAKLTFTEPDAFKGTVGGSLVLWRIFGVFGVVYSFFLAVASGATGLTLSLIHI